MPRRLFSPPPPKRRIVPRQPLSPEAEGLFKIKVKEEPRGAEEPKATEEARTVDDDSKPAPLDARPAPVPLDARPESPAVPPAPAPEPSPSAPKTPSWIVQARTVDLFAVARSIGVDIVPRADEPGLAIAPCPACGDDAGAAVVLNPRWNTRQWRCPSCKSFGGNLDLAAMCLMGSKLGELDEAGQEAMRGWFTDRGWCEEG